jgi:hypothetical protein
VLVDHAIGERLDGGIDRARLRGLARLDLGGIRLRGLLQERSASIARSGRTRMPRAEWKKQNEAAGIGVLATSAD